MPDSPLRIVFAGTPEFAAKHLQGLIDHGFKPIAVFTQPDRPVGRGKKIRPTPVKAVAEDLDIPVFQPEKLDIDAIRTLDGLKPDLIIVVAYGLILSQQTLDIPPLGCINVHASLLPRWRGAAPVERAILSGDTQTGVSIMQMDAGLDTGDVLLRLPTPITEDDNAQTLGERLISLGVRGLLQVLADLPRYQAAAERQDATQATYAAKLSKDDALIDWTQPALVIQHQIQAFFPRSPAWCWFQGERLRVISARRLPGDHQSPPGTILAVGEDSIHVACGTDALVIHSIQLPGKTPASLRDILNGHPGLFVIGASLAGAPAPE